MLIKQYSNILRMSYLDGSKKFRRYDLQLTALITLMLFIKQHFLSELLERKIIKYYILNKPEDI